MSGFVNPRQITKFQTGKALVEFNDRLSAADAEHAANLHSGFSKIYVVAMDYSNGTGDKSVLADLNLDPDTAKYLADGILRGSVTDFTEQKILAHKKNEAGESKVTLLSVKYNSEMRYPWNIVVENGFGIAETQATGGTALKKGSYRKEKQVKLFIDDLSMKRMMITLLDYVRTFEVANFNRLMNARFELEKKQKEAAAN